MKNKVRGWTLLTLAVSAAGSPAADIGTAFTYQGFLEKPAGVPLTDVCDFRFGLFDSESGPVQVGNSPQTVSGVTVQAGTFTAVIDFEEAGFNGTARWLEVEVRCPGDSSFILLNPRVRLRPVPHALSLPGLYTQQKTPSFNIIGGLAGNWIISSAFGATISGGGMAPFPNRIEAEFGTIGGGSGNEVIASGGVFGHGTVGGGFGNWAVGDYSTVGGGNGNRAGNEYATVAGGENNTTLNSGATVGGGSGNSATDVYATVAGGYNNSAGLSSFVGGGAYNSASGDSCSVVGGTQNAVVGAWSLVGGGTQNFCSGDASVIAAGYMNTAEGAYLFLGGGRENQVLAKFGTVGGGGPVPRLGAFTCAGGPDDGEACGSCSNNGSACAFTSTCFGGVCLPDQSRCGSPGYCPEFFGSGNRVTDEYGTVAGGSANQAGDGEAVATNATNATVGGGSANLAKGPYTTIAGGTSNTASGYAATVPGGQSCDAGGSYSFAAGRGATVRDATATGDADGDEGTFVWADANVSDFPSDGPNKFLVRAAGGTTFYSNSGLTTGVTLAAGGGSWAAASDANLKENFVEIDKTELLERLAAIKVATWNYKSQDESIRHIGPAAQEFHAAFGVGETDTRITTIDADGVALAAIQGLYEIVQEKDCEIETLREEKSREMDDLKAQVLELRAIVGRLTANEGGAR